MLYAKHRANCLLPAHLLVSLPPCSKVDQLAAKVGADPHLVSRAAMAMQQALGAAAADEGHTYLPWHRLEKDCGRLLRDAGMQHGNPWQHASALQLVAQHMHCSGALVAEPPPAAAGAQAAAAAAVAAEGQAEAAAVSREVAAPEAAAEAPSATRAHPTFEGIAELRQYLKERLKGALSYTRARWCPPSAYAWHCLHCSHCSAVSATHERSASKLLMPPAVHIPAVHARIWCHPASSAGIPAATVDALMGTHGEQAPAVLNLDLPQAVEQLR